MEMETKPFKMEKDKIAFQAETNSSECLRKSKLVLKSITLEPIVFVTALFGAMDQVVLAQLLVDKSCIQDMNYTQEVCDNILNDTYEHELSQVENQLTQYKVYESLMVNVFPAFISFFLGSWCDRYGRKIILYMFFTARIIEGCMLIPNVYYMEWSKDYLLLTNLPSSLCGGLTCYFMSCFAFIADMSTPEYRSTRIALVTLADTIGVPLGTQLGKVLFNSGGYLCVFSAALFGRVLTFTMLFILMEIIKPKPKNIPTQNTESMTANTDQYHPLNPIHVWESVKTTFKKRQHRKRLYILIYTVINISQLTFGDGIIGYSYVMTRYSWGFNQYSDYTTISQVIDITGQAIIIPLLSIIKIRDTLLVPILLSTIVTREFFKAFSSEPWMYYAAATLSLSGGYISSACRAIISKCVEPDEIGKVYALLSALQSLLPLGTQQVYASLWALTSELGAPWVGAVYMFSGGLIGVSFIASLISLALLGGEDVSNLQEDPRIEPKFRYIKEDENLSVTFVLENVMIMTS